MKRGRASRSVFPGRAWEQVFLTHIARFIPRYQALPGNADPEALPGNADPEALPGNADPEALPGNADPEALPRS